MTEYRSTRDARATKGLRGGWIAKRGKQVITAPAQWGCIALAAPRPLSARMALSTSALALGLALGMGRVTPAAAESCGPLILDGGATLSTCSSVADSVNDTTQTIKVTSGDATITTASDFGIAVSSGPAISIEGEIGSGNITFTDENESSITGATDGINARNKGSGALSITTSGTVTGAGASGKGIYARNYGSDTLSIITTGAVTATGPDGRGINAINSGTGGLSISSTSPVSGTGSTSKGIFASNSSTGTFLTISAADVSGSRFGIYARNYGSEDLSITTTGSVTSTEIFGNGIYAFNNGDGALRIVTQGSVTSTGTASAGIRAVNNSNTAGTYLTVETNGEVKGVNFGIQAVNIGNTGSVSITTTSSVEATATDGRGVYARNDGSGALNITTTGSVTATGIRGRGINAYNSSNGTSLTISAADVTGRERGIYARNFGTEALSITTTGSVTSTGSTASGIYARNAGISGAISITVEKDSTVSATSGLAIEAVTSGQSELNIVGTVEGKVNLGDGDATVNIASRADLSKLGEVDAGAGTNALNFLGFQGELDGSIFKGFSTILMTSGSPSAEVGFGSGVTAATSLTIDTGSAVKLNAAAATFTTPLLTNNGTIRTGLNMATITGDLAGTGTIVVDINFETGDFGALNVAGDLRAGSKQTIEVTPQGGALGPRTSFPVLSVTGAFDGTVELGTDVVTLGALTYDLSLDTSATPGTALVAIEAKLLPGENAVAAVVSSHSRAVIETFSRIRSLQSRQAARLFGTRATTASVSENLVPIISTQGALGETAPMHLGGGRAVTVGPWASLEVDRFNQLPDTGQQTKGTAWRFEGGYDALVDTAAEGTLVLGGGVVLGLADARFTAGGGTASSSASGGGVLLTATYFSPGGTFLDMELRAAHARSRLTAPDGTTLASGIGSTTILGMFELGHSFALDARSVLTPSVQVSLGQVRTQGYKTSDGDEVSRQRDDLSEQRFGLDYERALESGGSFAVFGAYSRDLSPATEVTVNGVSQTIRGPRDWAEAGLRLAAPIGDGTSLSGEVGYRTAVGALSAGNSNTFARVGLNFQW